ncbi:uncharacterized protein LOC127280484 [Leptopilina boulardi]|uniref:uncharacterized protein LOC127280484 n=1 Tax=Leptopilina boulardi TaxID=63433 RepID=UPI0021F67723|nr:uncharacterized protein LOC127280484 [Leptopilina boulardi]
MIRVDETDPVGEIEPSFPYRAVTVRKGVQFNDCYDTESEIGRGKFGTVYRCKEKKSQLALAAKVVSTTRKEDKRAVEREVEIMRRLQHPRLIQLYDAIDTGKQIYVILELIQGGELFERVIDDDFLLTERSCAVFMRQICEGIEFIHGQHILHLDMKPENILCLTKEGNRIKIIDFGLAREYDPKKKLQVLFGTPEFVAPEVVNFDQIGFGTDMWSIGVICYVLLSGLSPFMGDTDIETMANVTIAKYDFDDEAFSGISDDAKDFIRCLLVKDISKRVNASQCRQHRWLSRKINSSAKNGPIEEIKPKGITSGKEELDVTKDNLRLFVERWREHPNSPYTIEVQTIIEVAANFNERKINSGNNNNNNNNNFESISLCCHTPSSCESLSSSISESTTNSTRDHSSGSLLAIPNFGLALERRASEGARARDAAAQILLAEEIIKLSEHLRLIAMGSSDTTKKTNEKLKTVEERRKRKNSKDDEEEKDEAKIGETESVKKSGKELKKNGEVTNDTKLDASKKDLKTLQTSNREDLKNQINSSTNEDKNKISNILKKDGKTKRPELKESKKSETKSKKSINNAKKVESTIVKKSPIEEKSDATKSNQNEETKKSELKSSQALNQKDISKNQFETEENEISLKLSNIARQRKLNGTTFNGNRFEKLADTNSGNFTLKKTNKFNTVVFNDSFATKITDNFTIKPSSSSSSSSTNDNKEMDLIPPWRKSRPKRRFSESCRDVPRITNLQDLHKTLNLNEPKSTKDLLLQLLTEWDDARPNNSTNTTIIGRKSSVDLWCGDESIARRSINSLAEYFQAEQKKSATTSDLTSSIQR